MWWDTIVDTGIKQWALNTGLFLDSGRGRQAQWLNTTSTVISVGSLLIMRRPWTDSWSVYDDSWVAALIVGTTCWARLEHVGCTVSTAFTHTWQKGSTLLFRPIHCTASLLARCKSAGACDIYKGATYLLIFLGTVHEVFINKLVALISVAVGKLIMSRNPF